MSGVQLFGNKLGAGPGDWMDAWAPAAQVHGEVLNEKELATLKSRGKAIQAGGRAYAKALRRTCLVSLRSEQRLVRLEPGELGGEREAREGTCRN